MKLTTALCAILACSLATPAFAELETRRAQQNLFELTPIYTLNARNSQRPTVNLSYEYFRNVRLEEADNFNGYTTSAELIIPFGELNRWQARLNIPFRTEGRARTISPAKSIDIDGYGGVFDFATLLLQWELGNTGSAGCNSSAYLGLGHRTRQLDTSIADRYNHRGKVARLGYNIDNARAEQALRLQATADLRVYFDTDDLNPSDNGTHFIIMNLSGAAVHNAAGRVKPAVEVVYSTDFNKRQIVQIVPVMIIPLGERVELKGGYAVGHSQGEGGIQAATLRTTLRF